MYNKQFSIMAVSVVRVRPNGVVSWILLQMVMRIESEELLPQLQKLVSEFQAIHEETAVSARALDSLLAEIGPVLEDAKTIQADTAPLWDDAYTLCGDPRCDGDCRVCQDGEEDYEEDASEKYCRRRR
jgi:hypothetical protein